MTGSDRRRHVAREAWGLGAYVVTKATRYLEVGPARYRRTDALGRPEVGVPRATLATIRRAFEQIVAGRGARPSNALAGVDVHGLYAAMKVLHFGMTKRTTKYDLEAGVALDCIEFGHEQREKVVRVYNRVPLEGVQESRMGRVTRKDEKVGASTKRSTAKAMAGPPSPTRALAYHWDSEENGFADARERDPREAVVGLFLSDDSLCGGMSVAYWFETHEQLVAWCIRVVGRWGDGDGDEDEDPQDGDESITLDELEERSIRKLLSAMGQARRLAPVLTWLDAHMSGTSVTWSGTFEALCSGASGRELRTAFWAAEHDDYSGRKAPIPEAERGRFIEWLQALND